MSLYNISNDFQKLFDEFDELNRIEFDTDADGNAIDESGNIIENPEQYKQMILDAWFDTLEGIEGEFEQKAGNVAAYIKSLKAEAEDLKQEEKALKARRECKERQAEKLKKYLLDCMDKTGRTKIDVPRAIISIRNNSESLVVEDEISFINWLQMNNDSLLKYSLPEIKKSEVKRLYKTGVQFPYVHTERTRSLIIK